MNYVVTCQFCGAEAEVPSRFAGQQLQCPACGNIFVAPPKQCSMCGADVAGVKRWKDAAGSYFCDPCWASRNSDQPSDGLLAQAVGATPSAPANDDALAALATVVARSQSHAHRSRRRYDDGPTISGVLTWIGIFTVPIAVIAAIAFAVIKITDASPSPAASAQEDAPVAQSLRPTSEDASPTFARQLNDVALAQASDEAQAAIRAVESAVRALARLRAQVNTGVAFNSYTTLIADLKAELSLLNHSRTFKSEATTNEWKSLCLHLRGAEVNYFAAAEDWANEIKASSLGAVAAGIKSTSERSRRESWDRAENQASWAESSFERLQRSASDPSVTVKLANATSSQPRAWQVSIRTIPDLVVVLGVYEMRPGITAAALEHLIGPPAEVVVSATGYVLRYPGLNLNSVCDRSWRISLFDFTDADSVLLDQVAMKGKSLDELRKRFPAAVIEKGNLISVRYGPVSWNQVNANTKILGLKVTF